MDRRGQRLRFAVVATCVVLALTGFSTGRGHGHGSSHGHGGGCSSSGQDHDTSSSTGGSTGSRYHDYDDDDDSTDATSGSGGSSGSSGPSTALRDATVRLVDCATPSRAYATVEVDNPNTAGGYFTVTVAFLDAGSAEVEERTEDAYVAGNDTTTVQVDLSSPGLAAKVDHCDPEPYATAG